MQSVAELLVSILGHRFRVVAVLAERLPVAPIPEQFLVTTMGNDVVNHGCLNILTLGKATNTQWMSLKECFAFPLPSATVPTLASGACCFWVQGFVFLAVYRAVRNEPCTAGVFAWCVRTMRHGSFLPGKTGLAEMSIGTDLVVIHIQQIQFLDDASRGQIISGSDPAFNLT